VKQTETEDKKIIIGIDPGTRITGYGVIEVTKKYIKALDYGCIRPPVNAKLSDRYYIIFESLSELLSQYEPSEMAIETQFVYKNAQSALKLGIAQGVAIIQAKKNNMKVFGYSPREVKCAICGTGKAGKAQLQGAITRSLQLAAPPQPEDAADALAIAICHAEKSQNVLGFTLSNKEI
jgi:crossover junction endodeoxyribonuclease RuvC